MFSVFMKKVPVPLLGGMHQSKRKFWAYLNIIFNLVDDKRIREIGPDRACAEWLLRNGAAVTFDGDGPTKDYNTLACLSPDIRLKLIGIDASEASITHHGFRHLKDCKHIERIRMHKCWYISDKAVDQLTYVKDTLSNLHISSCDEVTDVGVKSIVNLRNLTQLTLANLRVKDWNECEKILQECLPDCKMTLNPPCQ